MLGEEELRTLKSIALQQLAKFDEKFATRGLFYTLRLQDGTELDHSNLEGILAEQNSSQNPIAALSVSGPARLPINPAFTITIKNTEFSLSYKITSDDRDWVFVTAAKLEDWLRSARRWHGFVWHPLVSILWPAIGILTGTAVFRLVTRWYPLPSDLHGIDPWPLFNLASMGLGALILWLVRGRLFPLVVFKIGAEKARYERTEALKARLFWGVLVAFFVGILATALWQSFRPGGP